MPLIWPDGWTIRPTDGGQLEVVHVMDTVVARTGTRIVLQAVSDTGSPLFRDGAMVVCPGPVHAAFREPDPTEGVGDALADRQTSAT